MYLFELEFSHSSTIYNSQDVEATYMSTDRGMDTEDEEYIYIYTALMGPGASAAEGLGQAPR